MQRKILTTKFSIQTLNHGRNFSNVLNEMQIVRNFT